MFGLHRRVRIAYRPALKSIHFTTFSCFFEGQRKVASREALWGGLLRIFEDFGVSLGSPFGVIFC